MHKLIDELFNAWISETRVNGNTVVGSDRVSLRIGILRLPLGISDQRSIDYETKRHPTRPLQYVQLVSKSLLQSGWPHTCLQSTQWSTKQHPGQQTRIELQFAIEYHLSRRKTDSTPPSSIILLLSQGSRLSSLDVLENPTRKAATPDGAESPKNRYRRRNSPRPHTASPSE
jgi:hypothetical protein